MWKIVNNVESFRAYLDNLAKMRKEIEQEHLKIKG